ncbi:Ig-like domain-containing protein [Candidatus Saccharibacteria bacterium]|nr:Ig-like domain-containing protein [Candidatus Saccharibacteria bacterium]
MGNVLVNKASLDDIADAIRDKNGTQNTYTPAQMAGAITALPTGISDVESVAITNKSAFENLSFSGTYLTIPLAVTVLPANAPQWTQVLVSDSSMIHVLDNGDGTHSLHILKGGTCTVTVKDYSGTISDTMTVTINQALEDISFAYTSLSVAEGGTRQLNVMFKPSTATDQRITWSSSHQDIVVDQNGLVTANGTGSATISAYSPALEKTITVNIEVAATPDTTDWTDVKQNWQNYGVGSILPSTLTYNNTTYTPNWIVVDANYDVTLPDGTSAKATIIMMDHALPFTRRYSTESKTACDSATEPVALADTYYYGYNGSTYTKLNVEVGDALPYSDYTAIYKTGLNMTKGFTALNNAYINRWDGSQLRAILNSDADNVSTSYTPVHITDRCDYTGKGFLQLIPPELVAVAGKIKVPTVNNNSCFDGDVYETEDLFWIPSAGQMQFKPSDWDGRPVAKNTAEGEPFQYYLTNIPTANNNSSTYRQFAQLGQTSNGQYWLRSANYSNANNELNGQSDGSLNTNRASAQYRLLPACAIIH